MDSKHLAKLLGVGHAEQLYAIERTIAHLKPDLMQVVFNALSYPDDDYTPVEGGEGDKEQFITEIVNLIRLGGTEHETTLRERLGSRGVSVDEVERLRDRIHYFATHPDDWNEKVESNATVPAENFMATIAANVANSKLSDADFREFVQNTLPIVEYPRPRNTT